MSGSILPVNEGSYVVVECFFGDVLDDVDVGLALPTALNCDETSILQGVDMLDDGREMGPP